MTEDDPFRRLVRWYPASWRRAHALAAIPFALCVGVARTGHRTRDRWGPAALLAAAAAALAIVNAASDGSCSPSSPRSPRSSSPSQRRCADAAAPSRSADTRRHPSARPGHAVSARGPRRSSR
ncbi:MAG: hypothetical protein LBE44_04860 [Microbacterium hominis]|nr:hypothetical protein [Microbacterium hominis]